MPRPLAPHPRVQSLRASVFATLADRMTRVSGRVLPLHIGDTYRTPPGAALLSSEAVQAADGLYAYGHPSGLPELLEALARHLRERLLLAGATAAHVQVTCGATHALFCIAQALFGPGDEVLVLAPYWPLIQGILQCAGATPVAVPFYQRLLDDPSLDPASLLEPFVTPRTTALYLNTPSNPTGLVLTRPQLESLAGFCQMHGLWAISDEAYADYLYDGRTHVSLASLPGLAERTLTTLSFSKSRALAGLRGGALVAPDRLMPTLRRIANHSVYNVPVFAQRSMLAALEHGDTWLAETQALYQTAANLVKTRLRGAFHPAQGGAYVFLDTSRAAPDVWSFIDRALAAGVSLAPGEAFGADFPSYVRLCFTAVPLPELEEAIDRLNSILPPDAPGPEPALPMPGEDACP